MSHTIEQGAPNFAGTVVSYVKSSEGKSLGQFDGTYGNFRAYRQDLCRGFDCNTKDESLKFILATQEEACKMLGL